MKNAHVPGKNLIVKSSLILDPSQLTPVEEALVLAQEYLGNFASEPDFGQKMVIAFGEGANVDSLRTAWSANDFSNFPEIEVRHAADINGANGAFAAATNRIYLSQEFITNHQADVGAIARVLLEEFGHFVDSRININDTPGDEGAIFAAFVRGDMLNESQLQKLETEDDTGIINIDGISLKAEFSYPDVDSGGNSTSTAYDLGTLGSAKKTTEISDYLGDDFVGYRDEADFFKFTLDTASKVNIVFVSGGFVGAPTLTPTASVRSGGSELEYYYTGSFGGYGDDVFFTNETIDFGVMQPGNYYFWIGLAHPAYSLYNYNAKLQVDPINNLDISISSDQGVIGIGPELTYTVNLTNNSSQSATDATTEIILPKGMEFVKADLQPTSNITDEITGETKLKFTIPNILPAGQEFSNKITTTVTGFSQPLDKLRNYQWNIDVKGSAIANILGTEVNDETLPISTLVDSSRGLAEDLVKRFSVNSNKIVDGAANDFLKETFQPFEKQLQTYKSSYSQQFQDIFNFDVKKAISEVISDPRNITQKLNSILLQVPNKAESAVVAFGKEKFNLYLEAGFQNLFPGLDKALNSSGLSLNNGVGTLTKPIGNGNFSFDFNIVKLEDIPTVILQSALKKDKNSVSSFLNSTANNFGTQASYNSSLGSLKVDYKNRTKAFSYDVGLSIPLFKGYSVGVSATGQISPGQSLPDKYLFNLIKPSQKDTPQNQRNLSPLGFTEESSESFQLIATSEAFTLVDSAITESTKQSDSLLAATQGNADSTAALLNSDGHFLAFTSAAFDLVADDNNQVTDVFIRNLQTNALERISLGDDETQANGESEVFAISDDGRYVVFASDASNLVDNDTNDVRDIFIRDTQTASTRRISLTSDGTQADGVSNLAAISGDGRYVVFSSIASNLVQGDTNGAVDVFLRDLQAGTTELISVANEGIQSNSDSLSPDAAISADGRYVVFYSYASNLVANDTNQVADIFLRDRQAGTTKRISVGINRTEANEISLSPSISADGRYVVFSSLASNLVSGDTNETGDIFVYDLEAETLERVSLTSDETELDSNSSRPSISADGRYVVFQSLAANLGVDNPDSYSNIYLRDRLTGETKLASPSLDGQIYGDSINPSISADGNHIAFESVATNLVEGDPSAISDIFVYKPVISQNSDPVTEANKTLTVLEDAAPIALAIATPTDADNDPLTIIVTAVPETTKGVIRLSDNTVVTANTSLTTEQLTSLVFAPVTNANGSAGTFSYTVSDGKGGTATQTLTLEITAVNDAPTAADDTATINQNTPLTLSIANLLANDSDIDGNSLSITAVSNGSNGSVVFDTEQGNIVFTPILNFSGAASFNYTVSDGNGGTSIATVAVTVNPSSQLNEITGTSGRDTLTGTSNSDRITGFQGADTLTGGGGNDQFVYTNIRDRGDTITDFEVGKDNIVFTQLLDSLVTGGYNGTNAIADGYVKVVQGNSASNFSVQIDADGPTGNDIFRPFITVNLAGTGAFNNPSNFVF